VPDPISAAREAAIRQAYKLEHQLYQLGNTSLAEIKAELEVTRRSVLSILATATKDWQISQAQSLLDEIERQIKAWGAFSTSAIGSRFPTVADIGVEQMTAALKAGGTSLSIGAGPMLSRAFIAVAYQSLPLMITDISTEATSKIGRILRQAVLAQRTPFDAMQEIGTITGKGVFGSALVRGETILRTEYGRIAQTANHAALSDVAQDNPTLHKEWSAIIDGRTRPTHAKADGQIRDVDKPYDLGGYPGLYPHDPQLPAEESINCRCISVAQDASWPDDRTKSTQVPEGATSLDIAPAPDVSSAP